MLGLLLRGEVCVCHIHESLGIPQPKASRHLAYLRRAGLVEARKQGQWVHYRLAALPDAVERTLVATVGHCLTHLPALARDTERLEQALGCCAPITAETPPILSCCAAARTGAARTPAPGVERRTRDTVLLRPAAAADLTEIHALLDASGLPSDGFGDHLDTALVACDGRTLVGVAALELHEPYGLLRSVAVAESHRGCGLGQALSRAALDLARRRGLQAVYLLTQTAAGFFPRLGFREIPRSEVPARVQESIQFTSVCCASAKSMQCDLTGV
jgi:amino-acid N-acetyltransferase